MPAANGDERASVYVLKMGQPVRIIELAERMIRLAGFEPGEEIEIAVTGTRPGERLHEILFAREEPRAEIGIDGVMAAKPVFADRERVDGWLEVLDRRRSRASDGRRRARVRGGDSGVQAPEAMPQPAAPALQVPSRVELTGCQPRPLKRLRARHQGAGQPLKCLRPSRPAARRRLQHEGRHRDEPRPAAEALAQSARRCPARQRLGIGDDERAPQRARRAAAPRRSPTRDCRGRAASAWRVRPPSGSGQGDCARGAAAPPCCPSRPARRPAPGAAPPSRCRARRGPARPRASSGHRHRSGCGAIASVRTPSATGPVCARIEDRKTKRFTPPARRRGRA